MSCDFGLAMCICLSQKGPVAYYDISITAHGQRACLCTRPTHIASQILTLYVELLVCPTSLYEQKLEMRELLVIRYTPTDLACLTVVI